MVEVIRGIPGIIVEKLLLAMKAQKQVAGIEAMAKRKNIVAAIAPPIDGMTAS
jgi:hypothetical protein